MRCSPSEQLQGILLTAEALAFFVVAMLLLPKVRRAAIAPGLAAQPPTPTSGEAHGPTS